MLVVLDAGHGGRDPGANYRGLLEKDIVLRLTKLVRDHLRSNFVVDVLLTRDSDEFIGLSRRAQIANERDADLFLAIHVNAGGGEGFESYVYSGSLNRRTRSYQDVIHETVLNTLRRFGVRDRGQKEANLAVLRETTMPAVLLEVLFIDTAPDRELLRDDSFLRNTAAAISMGIADALDLPEQQVGGISTGKPSTGENTGSSDGIIFRVQAGAFESLENAEELAGQLEDQGFQSYVYEEGGLFKVQAGAFSEYENARQLATALNSDGFQSFIHT
jgi:N-acetylmuramoyl-L-alanine amidase